MPDISGEKRTRTNKMISVIGIYLLQTVLMTAEPGVTKYNASKFRVLSLKSKYLET